LVERIDALDTIVEQLVEDEADTGSSGKFVKRQVVGVTIDGGSELRRELGNDRKDNIARTAVTSWSTEGHEFCVVFLQVLGNTGLDVRKCGPDVMHQDHVELPCEERCTAELGLALVRRVILEIVTLVVERSADGLVSLDISLASVYNRHVAQPQRDDSPSQNINDISSFVPVELSAKTSGVKWMGNIH